MSANRIVCWLTGKHVRSRKHARTGDDGQLRSHCTRCGKPLMRTMRGGARVWRVDQGEASMRDAEIGAGEEHRSATRFDP